MKAVDFEKQRTFGSRRILSMTRNNKLQA